MLRGQFAIIMRPARMPDGSHAAVDIGACLKWVRSRLRYFSEAYLVPARMRTLVSFAARQPNTAELRRVSDSMSK